MTYPKAIEINGLEYAIHTEYETALACFKCINDPDITEIERAMGVLGLLYMEQPTDEAAALRLAVKFLSLGKEPDGDAEDDRHPDMDYEQDMHYIRASFRSVYGIDLKQTPEMHWWEFSELLSGLTDDCVLNRIRDIRNLDLSSIKDPQARSRFAAAQYRLALPDRLSDDEQKVIDDFYAQLK